MKYSRRFQAGAALFFGALLGRVPRGIWFACQLDPSAQYFANAPSLRDTSLRSKRRVTVENLAERAEPVALNRGPHGLEKAHRRHAVGVNPMMRQGKGTEQPRPHRSLVISGVAFARPAAV